MKLRETRLEARSFFVMVIFMARPSVRGFQGPGSSGLRQEWKNLPQFAMRTGTQTGWELPGIGSRALRRERLLVVLQPQRFTLAGEAKAFLGKLGALVG